VAITPMPLETAPPATKMAAIPATPITTIITPSVRDLATALCKLTRCDRDSVKNILLADPLFSHCLPAKACVPVRREAGP
jgi:hypothetical protein